MPAATAIESHTPTEWQSIIGSEREFVRRGILRGLPHFLKSDVFNVGSSHALYLEE